MTDKEAYELLVMYSGEQGIVMIKEMVHEVGIDKALENINQVYADYGMPINNDMKWWMRQAFKYMIESTKQTSAGFDYKSRDWEKSKMRPAPQAAIDALKERWASEGKRECPDCGVWFKSEGRCPECNPLG